MFRMNFGRCNIKAYQIQITVVMFFPYRFVYVHITAVSEGRAKVDLR